jgi:NADH-quinone oxidoreductase subunit C
MPCRPETLEAIKQRFPGVMSSEFRGATRVVVPVADAYGALEFLKQKLRFDYLVDVTCVDYLNYRDAADRYGLAYLLTNTVDNERLTVRVFLNDPDPRTRSVVPLWEGANWLEREVFDMFGIVFDGHPDLRRILMPEEFTAFSLRKDYPLRGRGERHNFPVLRRGQA